MYNTKEWLHTLYCCCVAQWQYSSIYLFTCLDIVFLWIDLKLMSANSICMERH